MKLLSDTAWFRALTGWRRQRRSGDDPGDMGTAFGLDSITVIDFEPTSAPGTDGDANSAHDWQRRVTRRSTL